MLQLLEGDSRKPRYSPRAGLSITLGREPGGLSIDANSSSRATSGDGPDDQGPVGVIPLSVSLRHSASRLEQTMTSLRLLTG